MIGRRCPPARGRRRRSLPPGVLGRVIAFGLIAGIATGGSIAAAVAPHPILVPVARRADGRGAGRAERARRHGYRAVINAGR